MLYPNVMLKIRLVCWFNVFIVIIFCFVIKRIEGIGKIWVDTNHMICLGTSVLGITCQILFLFVLLFHFDQKLISREARKWIELCNMMGFQYLSNLP